MTLSIPTRFDLLSFGSVDKFLYREMVLFGGSFWVYFGSLFVALLGFINSVFFRFRGQRDCSGTVDSSCVTVNVLPQEKSPARTKPNVDDSVGSEDFFADEEEAPRLFSGFQFKSYEEFIGSNVGDGESDIAPASNTSKYELSDIAPASNTSKYELSDIAPASNTSKYELSDIAPASNTSKYELSDIAPASNTSKYEFISGKAFGVLMEEPEAVSFTVKELYAYSNNDSHSFSKEDVQEESPVISRDQDDLEDVSEIESAEFPSEKDLIGSDFSSDSLVSSHDFSGLGHYIDSNTELDEPESTLEDVISNEEDIAEELQKLEEHEDDTIGSDMSSQVDFRVDNSSKDDDPSDNDLDDSNGFESLWEHQELIEQLKMELKKVKATGLPTIPEESEYPKMMEDLKPWTIEEKMEHRDTIGELHKFYESYRERMRKFDILNYQKMYAIGFLQSKEPLQSISISKSSIPVIGSLLHESFHLCKRKKSKSDPMVKFMRELHSDLEMVYVGQLCLSWEFLHWQYEKTLELWESDPRGTRRYNEVAGEFQQFQVLIQRFIENEPFEGPRVLNYVKNRCILRNLLQVPVIREDTLMDKRERSVYAVTSDMLVEIMEESIRLLWQFIRADKDTHAHNGMQIVRKENQAQTHDPADKKLLMEVRDDHHKKERKLKEILRSGNCILRKFWRHGEEESSEQVLYFFSQVDMKLVGRVLNMSRITTEQLVWCHNKLNKISFVNRKINVEPSFLLFPC